MYFYNLIKNYQNGNRKSLELLIEHFQPLLKKMSKELEYEEGYTDLIIFFIELMNKIQIYKFRDIKDSAIISYIRKSLNNKKIDLNKTYKRKIIKIKDIELETIYENYYEIEENTCFKEYIFNRFSGIQKKVILFKYIEGYTETEISKILNISRQAVNSAKNRALRQFKDDYKKVI